MADKRTWADTYTLVTKGPSCLSGASKIPEWKRCLTLPDDASDADRIACQKSMQKVFLECTAVYEAYKGSGGKDVPEPPKPPKK